MRKQKNVTFSVFCVIILNPTGTSNVPLGFKIITQKMENVHRQTLAQIKNISYIEKCELLFKARYRRKTGLRDNLTSPDRRQGN